ncbi:hypothetical protein HDU76_003417 [Blyttiomyces sp. JEL0837]|nr:hypothetical protein HDU76_003417 [Blyttiomyces sp. JEL0837]
MPPRASKQRKGLANKRKPKSTPKSKSKRPALLSNSTTNAPASNTTFITSLPLETLTNIVTKLGPPNKHVFKVLPRVCKSFHTAVLRVPFMIQVNVTIMYDISQKQHQLQQQHHSNYLAEGIALLHVTKESNHNPDAMNFISSMGDNAKTRTMMTMSQVTLMLKESAIRKTVERMEQVEKKGDLYDDVVNDIKEEIVKLVEMSLGVSRYVNVQVVFEDLFLDGTKGTNMSDVILQFAGNFGSKSMSLTWDPRITNHIKRPLENITISPHPLYGMIHFPSLFALTHSIRGITAVVNPDDHLTFNGVENLECLETFRSPNAFGLEVFMMNDLFNLRFLTRVDCEEGISPMSFITIISKLPHLQHFGRLTFSSYQDINLLLFWRIQINNNPVLSNIIPNRLSAIKSLEISLFTFEDIGTGFITQVSDSMLNIFVGLESLKVFVDGFEKFDETMLSVEFVLGCFNDVVERCDRMMVMEIWFLKRWFGADGGFDQEGFYEKYLKPLEELEARVKGGKCRLDLRLMEDGC